MVQYYKTLASDGKLMKKEFIVYRGCKFTIEWYFDDRGKSLPLEYFEELSFARKKKLWHLLRILGDLGKLLNEEKFRYEGDQVYALKPHPDRFLCFFFEGSKIIITNAYEKKTAKMPVQEKRKALQAKAEYIERISKGEYYD
jgi:hypothetical protein